MGLSVMIFLYFAIAFSKCGTDTCQYYANQLKNYVDLTADPCDDGFQFMCGNFNKDKKQSGNILAKAGSRVRKNVKEMIKDGIEKNSWQAPFDSIKTLWESCNAHDFTVESLFNFYKTEVLWEPSSNPAVNRQRLAVSMAKHHRITGMTGLMGSMIRRSTNITDLRPHDNYFVFGDTPSKFIVDFNNLKLEREEIKKLVKMLNEDGFHEIDGDLIVNFEIMRLYMGGRREFDRLHKIDDLAPFSHGIDFKLYFQTLFDGVDMCEGKSEGECGGEADVVLVNTSELKLFNGIIMGTEGEFNLEFLRDYMFMHFITKFAHLLPGKYKWYFESKTALRYPETRKEDKCVYLMTNLAGWLLARPYVDRYLNDNDESIVEDMSRNIIHEIEKGLAASNWLEPPTKDAALAKLRAMRVEVLYPDFMKDDVKLKKFLSTLKIDENDNFVAQMAAVSSWGTSEKLATAFQNSFLELWNYEGESPLTTNAFYDPLLNTFYINAGILEDPMYRTEMPPVLLYSRLGYVIGHEIMHGFDKDGRKYNADGNEENWWTKGDEKFYEDQSECYIKQYEAIPLTPSDEQIKPRKTLHVNGRRTLGENIADNEGGDFAFAAYLNTRVDALDGLDIDPIKTFFLSMGSIWCAQYSYATTEHLIQNAVHPFGAARVIGPLQNNIYYSQAFGCKAGSQMNPEKKCRIFHSNVESSRIESILAGATDVPILHSTKEPNDFCDELKDDDNGLYLLAKAHGQNIQNCTEAAKLVLCRYQEVKDLCPVTCEKHCKQRKTTLTTTTVPKTTSNEKILLRRANTTDPKTTTTTTVCDSVNVHHPREICQESHPKVTFMVDASSSINFVDFEKQVKFVKEMISTMGGDDTWTAALMTFSTQATVEFNYGQYFGVKNVSDAIDKHLKWKRGATFLGRALDTYVDQIKPKENEHLVIITDGEPSDWICNKEKFLRTMKVTGNTLSLYLVGERIQKNHFLCLTDDKNVVQVKNFDYLPCITCGREYPENSSIPTTSPSSVPAPTQSPTFNPSTSLTYSPSSQPTRKADGTTGAAKMSTGVPSRETTVENMKAGVTKRIQSTRQANKNSSANHLYTSAAAIILLLCML